MSLILYNGYRAVLTTWSWSRSIVICAFILLAIEQAVSGFGESP